VGATDLAAWSKRSNAMRSPRSPAMSASEGASKVFVTARSGPGGAHGAAIATRQAEAGDGIGRMRRMGERLRRAWRAGGHTWRQHSSEGPPQMPVVLFANDAERKKGGCSARRR